MISFKAFLEERLQGTLPGREAQQRMAPSPSNKKLNYRDRNHDPEDIDYRNSSVLVPITSWGDELRILLTLRTADIKHGGQISFPGGGREGDETFEETALREAHEETGLESEHVKIVGTLSPLYVNHSENLVTPVVGFIDEEQEFTRNPNEVDEIFLVPLEDLLKSANHVREEWELKGTSFEVPFWDIHRVPLWGATAMMMSELIELYKEFKLQISNSQ